MRRLWILLLSPEGVLTLVTAAVFWFCGRHNAGEGPDVLILEKLIMGLPLMVVPLVFATVLVPGARNWWWLGRAVAFTFIGLMICAGKIIAGFGSGAKGQDAAFMLVLGFALVLVSLGTAVSGAMILTATKPAIAEWFRVHRFLAVILTLLSAVPIGFALGVVLATLIGVGAGLWSAFQN